MTARDVATEWREQNAADWFQRTGHCGGCGQPGTFCLCRDSAPCGCAYLHAMGSGLAADPTEIFAQPAPVLDSQTELFDGAP